MKVENLLNAVVGDLVVFGKKGDIICSLKANQVKKTKNPNRVVAVYNSPKDLRDVDYVLESRTGCVVPHKAVTLGVEDRVTSIHREYTFDPTRICK